MKTYLVEITETLQKLVEVEAKNPTEAIKKVRVMYKKSDIILDEGNFVDVEFDIV